MTSRFTSRDGAAPRQARAVERRARLLQAAVELLTEGGFAALTHRAVAARARLPLAATTYYFASRDQLLTEAFAELVERDLADLQARLARHGPTALLATRDRTCDRIRQLGLWELYVHAGRDPALQRVARRWTDGCLSLLAAALGRPTGDPTVRLAYAALSALWLEHLVEQRHDGPAEAAALLHTLLEIPSNPHQAAP
ncbi:TetR/AcrR family transcriptional regulator [Thermoactinospora rubra]|uniref:TetR/AcrR family transcriptional regulator n=1 Tax=Thermoactinospora rubra TaxID=1088767 RepID=UPI000A0F5FBB|nr:TetR family transcriptional regulator [Thermoactinospora rubra]